jgi:hypothetical protein
MTQCSSLHKISKHNFPVRKEYYYIILHTIFLSLLVLIICESSLFAQNKYDFSQFGNETGDFIKQPSKWDSNDWLRLGVIGAGSFFTYQNCRSTGSRFYSQGQKLFIQRTDRGRQNMGRAVCPCGALCRICRTFFDNEKYFDKESRL